MKTYKIGSHQVLPLSKVGPIKMRQLAHGHINERPPIMVNQRHRGIVKGYRGIFVIGIDFAFPFFSFLPPLVLGLITIPFFGTT
jgi:hypothetical protein